MTGESEQAEGDTNTNTRTAALWCDEVEHDAKFSGSAPVKEAVQCRHLVANIVQLQPGKSSKWKLSFGVVVVKSCLHGNKEAPRNVKIGAMQTKLSRNHELTTLTIFLLIFNKHSLHTHTAFVTEQLIKLEKEAYLKDEDATFEVQNVDVMVLFRCFLFVCFLAEAN